MHIHVTLLGKEALPLYYPIKQSDPRPDKVYIIGTNDNKIIAERLQNLLTKNQNGILDSILPKVKSLEFVKTSPFDYNSTINACNEIHRLNPDVPAENFTYNVTGGTKVMTLAAFQVAKERNCNIIYTDSKSIKHLSPDNLTDTPLNCNITIFEIIALQGQIIKDAQQFDLQKDAVEISAAEKVFEFWMKKRSVYQGLREAIFGKKGENDNVTIPNFRKFDVKKESYIFECSEKDKAGMRRLEIYNNYGERFLDIKCKDPKSLLLKGVWWEVLVADAIAKRFPDYPIWRNVKFKPVDGNGEKYVKNEVDVLVNIGSKFLFVECKSGAFNSDVIHKMNTVRATFGGEKSKAVLVSASSTKEERYQISIENAQNTEILVISPNNNFADEKFLNKIVPQKIQEFLNKNTI